VKRRVTLYTLKVIAKEKSKKGNKSKHRLKKPNKQKARKKGKAKQAQTHIEK